MAGSLNKVQLIGHLGSDPEVKSFQNGGKIANLRLATSESWKDRNSGERKERTDWHNVSVQAEHAVNFVENYCQKGSYLYIEGQLRTRKWQDQQGNDRYTTEVVVAPYSGTVTSLDKRGDGDGNRGGRSSGGGGRYGDGDVGRGQSGGEGGGGGYSRADLDDEIPF